MLPQEPNVRVLIDQLQNPLVHVTLDIMMMDLIKQIVQFAIPVVLLVLLLQFVNLVNLGIITVVLLVLYVLINLKLVQMLLLEPNVKELTELQSHQIVYVVQDTLMMELIKKIVPYV